MAAVTYEYMNPNYKETLDREWWVTSYQLMPDPEYLEKIKNKDPSVTEVDASCRQLQGSRCAGSAWAARRKSRDRRCFQGTQPKRASARDRCWPALPRVIPFSRVGAQDRDSLGDDVRQPAHHGHRPARQRL